MNCTQVRHLLPGYLDGALPDRTSRKNHTAIVRHLDTCASCREEGERYLQLSMMMASMGSAVPPANLLVSIRVAVADARAKESVSGMLHRWKDAAALLLANVLEPLAIPATAGVVVALIVFSLMYQVLGVSIPLGAASADLPTNLLQPARLEMLAGFRMAELAEMSRTGGQHPLLVEATVSAEGQATSYRVLSGSINPVVQRELDQVLLFSRFRPQMSFGRPTSGGHIVLSFNEIRVRG